MKVLASMGREDIALVYIVEFEGGRRVECVESLQPSLPRERKWVLLVSTMFGCPVGCRMCDAGGGYQGKLSREQILAQIDFLVRRRYADGKIPSQQFKIQFARMGEPALNPEVLRVLEQLPQCYEAPGLLPSVSTIAPRGAEQFLEELIEIKRRHYSGGRFQIQLSIHTTDQAWRDYLIPVKKWGFEEMAAFGERYHEPGDLKITLNFALARGIPVDAEVLRGYFSPEKYLIKITPLNPTYRAAANHLETYINPAKGVENGDIIQSLRQAGYEVIVSVGEVEENYIGSNCGQYLQAHLRAQGRLEDGYTYVPKQTHFSY
jgi:23S rRNA (adenine2503-C2)-methyltransferase